MATIERDGYSIAPDVFTAGEIQATLTRLSGDRRQHSRAGMRHALGCAVVKELAYDARLTRLASEALGTPTFPFNATLFSKTQETNWLVVWHQDTALPMRKRSDVAGWGPWSVKEGVVYAHAPATALSGIVALRVHLDDSTESNGPLRVLPGTHEMGILSDEELHRVSRETPSVDCAVPRGGVLAMRPLLVHSSPKSREHRPRRVLHIEYAGSFAMGDGLELATA